MGMTAGMNERRDSFYLKFSKVTIIAIRKVKKLCFLRLKILA